MMRLFTQICILYLPLYITARESSDNDHSFTALRNISKGRALETCEGVGGGCWWDSNCCGSLECLGVNPANYACGNTPGKKGEYCNSFYKCSEELLCHDGECHGYEDVLLQDDNTGTCAKGSPSDQLQVMSYNVFLIKCIAGGHVLTCDDADNQKARMNKMGRFMQGRHEDVVMFQELFAQRELIIENMEHAGFCHYVATPFGLNGSGMAIFSKHPIEKVGFMDFNDNFTPTNPEAYSDKGVMYARINNGGTISHIFNTHTQSDSFGDNHEIRMGQYAVIKKFAQRFSIPNDQLILFGGDMNENKFAEGKKSEYYGNMLRELDTTDIPVHGNKYSYDTTTNPFLKQFWKSDDYRERLDYVVVSHLGAQVDVTKDARCTIPHATFPKHCTSADCQISDHYPVTCKIKNIHHKDQSWYKFF